MVARPQSQKAAYASVVHGSKKKPSNGSSQLSNARLRTLLKIHSRNSASRGEIRANSAIRQGMVQALTPGAARRHPLRMMSAVQPENDSSASFRVALGRIAAATFS